ncbi:MAG: polyprenyl synthetase family protein [Cuniculiplasma sp.]
MTDPKKSEKFKEYLEVERLKINQSLQDYFQVIIDGVNDREMKKIVTEIRNYTMNGGKRVRPILIATAFRMFGGRGDEIYRAAISIELSQSFFLIHDDIMDRSDLRRGFKSFHRKVEEMLGDIKDREHMAESLAIVAGDLAVDYSFDALTRSNFPLTVKFKALQQLVEIIKVTGYGEGLDMFSSAGVKLKMNDLIRLHLRKTAKYTLEGPLLMGSYLAGRDENLNALKAYGNLVGLAFQLHDDVIGLFGTQKEIGKPPKSDVNEGKQTLLIIKAMERAEKGEKEFIQKCLDSGDINDHDFERLKEIVKNTHSYDYSRWLIERFIESGKKYISQIDGNPEQKEFLEWFADYLVSRRY